MLQGNAIARARGFSLIELMFAMSITMGLGLIVFQMFLQNERVFQDQNLVLEMQQSTRAVASMVVDEVRKAGQGIPVYSAGQDAAVAEAAQAFLDGTNAGTLRFRAGIRNAVTTTANPLAYTLNNSATITVASAASINAIVGANTGRFVYLWGPTANSWTWVRAEITAINAGANQITATPRQMSGQGGTFSSTPTVSLEEGISYRLSNGAILRGTTTTFHEPHESDVHRKHRRKQLRDAGLHLLRRQ